MKPVHNVAILIFDDVELLDFCGPLEVFSTAGRQRDPRPFTVYTVAESTELVRTYNGLSVQPHYDLDSAPPADIALVPGGQGTRREMHNRRLLDWTLAQADQADLLLSVCTGALLLGAAGLLDGRDATTHHGAVDLLGQVAPRARLQAQRRVIDNGDLLLAAGVASGIDLALHVVARLLGVDEARDTAHYIEYPWDPSSVGSP
jgi:transcriptional regulator GlxA family with amidase domain